LGDTTTNYQIMPGDRIFVATRSLCEQLLPINQKSCPLCKCGMQCPCIDAAEPPFLPTVVPSVPQTIGSEPPGLLGPPPEELQMPPPREVQ
ncbi:MAG TPA: hypothetical protein VHY20_13665, partial [Pirellulales bacterium]|nr:hypothetical protein [Pirellulales bacterium]